jgi:hypothetical protein
MSRNTDFATELSDIYRRMADLKLEETSLLETAKDSGVNVKALRRVAKEMVMDSEKLEKRFDDEHQLEMFRDEVSLRSRKGLVMEAA